MNFGSRSISSGNPLANNRGMALLLTLTIISLLVVFSLELNRRARLAVYAIAATRDQTILYHMAASGIHAGMALLVEDKMDSQTDTVQEPWANPEIVDVILQALPFDAGTVKVTLSDELGRLQVNAIVEFPSKNAPNDPQLMMWERFLVNFVADDEDFAGIEPRTIVNSLKDWIDDNDDDAITGLTGAEADYYADLDDPYACRNGPMPHLSDMVRVRGVTHALFYGSEENPGISNFATVYGIQAAQNGQFTYPGRINIGTATLPVLTALMPIGSEGFAQAIVDYREEMSGDEYVNDISGSTWYTDVPGISALDGENMSVFQGFITTVSDVFRIEATAERNDFKAIVSAVVKREQDDKSGKWKCRVMSWETR